MNPSGTSAGLGLVSAASWGGSDFVGGIGARRAPALLVVASGHIVSFFILLAYCLGIRLALPGSHYLLYALIGGFEGSIALAIFYRALAMGAMGLTAALTGVLTALVPVVFSVFMDGLPSLLTALGLAAGLAAIWLITHSPSKDGPATPPAALLLGALAGTGFGAQLILFKMASAGGLLWTMTSARAAGSVAMILVILVKPPKGPWRGFWQTGILAGLLDTMGNLFYIRATQIGRLDVAAVVCSLYPAGTILLAALVLHERPTRRQIAGMAIALVAVMLLSL
ncbi:MAG TPA: DMT family transporter [Terracidiphilus sp.]|nr:DMT family transporter [Terracidiphilus sp.]